jgi:hypothetical protein
MVGMVIPLDATAACVSDDWARLGDAENTLEAIRGLRDSVRTRVVDGSIEGS